MMALPLQLFGSNSDLGMILNLLWIVMFFVVMFYGNALQVWRWTKQIEAALFKLNRMSEESREILTKTIKDLGKPAEDPSKAVASMLEFVTIEPVSLDPAGVIQRLDHVLDVRKSRYEDAVARMAPKAGKDEASNLEGTIEAASAVYFIFKVVRHYYILGKKTKNMYVVLQVSMQLHEIMRIAKAYFEALKAFSLGKPIGDGLGPLVTARMLDVSIKNGVKPIIQEDVAKEVTVMEVELDGRKVLLIRAKGPGSRVGKPGEAIERIVEEHKGDISRIIMVDAAGKLEGETTGDIVEGVGAAIGDPGPEKYKIEEVAVKYKIPVDAILVKEAIEEAVMPMKKEITDAADKVSERVREIIKERTEPGSTVIVAGIGNTVGVG
nr:DUF1512 domain-containing protein [Candidatus Njordarchaeota archaeon]